MHLSNSFHFFQYFNFFDFMIRHLALSLYFLLRAICLNSEDHYSLLYDFQFIKANFFPSARLIKVNQFNVYFTFIYADF